MLILVWSYSDATVARKQASSWAAVATWSAAFQWI